ncbi:MAG: hypothetical protein JWO82_4090, partial [Akkermansiaceae bacterium]|nr:hypothetical protein [Akkermansiaceae bacterium]
GNALENLALDIAGVFRERTNLIFINSRGTGEMLTDELNELSKKERWPRNPFLLHHGSLSKEIREEVEERLKEGEQLSVFCTSTLEMGIDIGSVHSVGQLGPPWSVASLVQRLGRSGRREGESSILRLFSLDPPPGPASTPDELLCPQLIRSIAMVELLREKWLEPFDSGVPQFSTLIHQTLSLLRQTGGCHFVKLRDTLLVHGAFREVTIAQYKSLLKSLAAHELIEQMASNEIILSPGGERITHSRDFYAAFQGTTEYAIRCGQLDIGKLPQTSLPQEGENFLLNGRRWKVEQIDPKSLVVEVTPARSRKMPIFLGAAGAVHSRIAAKMAEILQDEEVPVYLHSDAASLLQSARAYAATNEIFRKPFLEKTGRCILVPWTGSKGLETLKVFATAAGIETARKNLTLTYICSPADLQEHLEKVAGGFFQATDHAAKVSERYVDKYDSYVPDDLLDLANSVRALSQEEAVAAAKAVLAR